MFLFPLGAVLGKYSLDFLKDSAISDANLTRIDGFHIRIESSDECL